PRFAFVHIASMPSSNQINSMESQTIHIIQLLCGPTLIPTCGDRDLFDGAERAGPARSGAQFDAAHRASSRSSPRIGAKVPAMAGRMGSYHRRLL
ncbi:hypothetical protein, partial [Aurantimonas sp. A3-2-R12]|uniref:hypothetical protein n=1 Tax=Aurantimonas sp. A3-2-R12 TaxID=3114362 RepID=UPI002E19294A|nr:hypothetical protein [Aurantimonas sp. A3-2-R12]